MTICCLVLLSMDLIDKYCEGLLSVYGLLFLFFKTIIYLEDCAGISFSANARKKINKDAIGFIEAGVMCVSYVQSSLA